MIRVYTILKLPHVSLTTRWVSSLSNHAALHCKGKGVIGRRSMTPHQQSPNKLETPIVRSYSILHKHWNNAVPTKPRLSLITIPRCTIKHQSRRRPNHRGSKKAKREKAARVTPSSQTKRTPSSSSSTSAPSATFPNSIQTIQRLLPRLPGGNRPLFQYETILPLSRRVAVFLLVSYILTHEDTPQFSPIHIDVMDGPSMIPTIWPGGEMYLRDSLRHKLATGGHYHHHHQSPQPSNNATDKDDNSVTSSFWTGFLTIWNDIIHSLNLARDVRVGDVVVFVDNRGQYCCKRIIGVSGDVVQREGEFASTLFREVEGLGVPALLPPTSDRSSSSPSSSSSSSVVNTTTTDGSTKVGSTTKSVALLRDETKQDETVVSTTSVTVPDGHVWVEGDNPLYSIDSRHYGPLPLSNVRGRILYRIWPRRRRKVVGVEPPSGNSSRSSSRNESGDHPDLAESDINSCFVTGVRPRPIVLRPGEVYGGN